MNIKVIFKLSLGVYIELLLFGSSEATFFGFKKKIDFDSGMGFKGKWDEKMDFEQIAESMMGLPNTDNEVHQKTTLESDNYNSISKGDMNMNIPISDSKKTISIDNQRTETSQQIVNGNVQPKVSVTVTQNNTQTSTSNNPSQVNISARSGSSDKTLSSKTTVEREENSVVQTKSSGSSDIHTAIQTLTNKVKKSDGDDGTTSEPSGGSKLEFDLGFGDYNKHFKLI